MCELLASTITQSSCAHPCDHGGGQKCLPSSTLSNISVASTQRHHQQNARFQIPSLIKTVPVRGFSRIPLAPQRTLVFCSFFSNVHHFPVQLGELWAGSFQTLQVCNHRSVDAEFWSFVQISMSFSQLLLKSPHHPFIKKPFFVCTVSPLEHNQLQMVIRDSAYRPGTSFSTPHPQDF